MAVNKKGIEIKEYPKLIRVEGRDKKVLVNSPMEEAQYTNIKKTKEEKKSGWGDK